MKSRRWGCWWLLWVLWMSVGGWGCPRVRHNTRYHGAYSKESVRIKKALQILAQMRRAHRFTAAQDAEALGRIERSIFSEMQDMRLAAQSALVSFGAEGAPLWRRVLVWRQGEASHTYYLRDALTQMRLLGKDIRPLLPDLMRLLFLPDNSVYWAVLGILQVGGDLGCEALGEAWQQSKRSPPTGGMDITKAQRRILLTMVRLSPVCRAQWKTALIEDLALQGAALEVLRSHVTRDGMAYLRLLLEAKEQIITENRVLWRQSIGSVLSRVRNEAVSLQPSTTGCRTKRWFKGGKIVWSWEDAKAVTLLKGGTFAKWSWEDVKAVMTGFREAIREGHGREALFGDTAASGTSNAILASYGLDLAERLARCQPLKVFDFFGTAFRGHTLFTPNLQSLLFYQLTRWTSLRAAWLHERYTKGRSAERRLAFRLLASNPKATGLSVGEMLEVLSGTDQEMALWAMQGLNMLGPDAAMAFPAVMRWAEKHGKSGLSSGQRRLIDQTAWVLSSIGIQSKAALSMCAVHWREVEEAHLRRHPREPSYSIAQRCFLGLQQMKKPWEIATVQEWSALVRSIKQQRWSFLTHAAFLREESKESVGLWVTLFRLAADAMERQRVMNAYHLGRVGQRLVDLRLVWLGLRDDAMPVRREALQVVTSSKSEDKTLRAFLMSGLETAKAQDPQIQGAWISALGRVGRKDPKVRDRLLRRLWKAELSEQSSILLALQGRKESGCVVAQEMLELFGKVSSLNLLGILAEQSSCMRLAFPFLLRLTKQTSEPLSGLARSLLSHRFRTDPKPILAMVGRLSVQEQTWGWWAFQNPVIVYQPSALQDVFSLMDATEPKEREMAALFLGKLQGANISTAQFAPVLFAELAHPNPKRRAHAARLLGESAYVRGWLGWLKEDKKRYPLMRGLFQVAATSDVRLRLSLIGHLAWFDQEVMIPTLRWALLDASMEVRKVAVEVLQRRAGQWDVLEGVLVESLRTGTKEVRLALLGVLWWHKQRLPALLPVVRGFLRDKDRALRWMAGRWVAWMSDAAAISVLREILSSGTLMERREVVPLLGALKHESASLVSDIRGILTYEKDATMVMGVLYALAEWGERASVFRDILEPRVATMGRTRLYLYSTVRLLGAMGQKGAWAAEYVWALAFEQQSSLGSSAFSEVSKTLGQMGISILPKVLAELR